MFSRYCWGLFRGIGLGLYFNFQIKIQLDRIVQEVVNKQSSESAYLFHVEVLHGLDARRAESEVGQKESLGRRHRNHREEEEEGQDEHDVHLRRRAINL